MVTYIKSTNIIFYVFIYIHILKKLHFHQIILKKQERLYSVKLKCCILKSIKGNMEGSHAE